MDSQQLNPQQDPVHQTEGFDADEVPTQYGGGKAISGLGRGSQKKRNDSPSRQSTSTGQHTMLLRERTRGVCSHARNYSVPANDSPSIFQKFSNLMTWTADPKRSSPRGAVEQHRQKRYQTQNDEEHPPEEIHDGISPSESISIPQNDIIKLQQEFQNIIEGKEREWEAKERELQRHIGQISQVNHDLDKNIHMLQSRLTETNSEKLLIQEQHNDFIRKQQEASFRQMESARWLPMDEGKVVGDLDRLKRSMRTWAKAASIKDLSLLSPLKEVEYATLMEDLGNVALIENGQLPEGLSATAKSPMLLLNALLAHSVYTSFFRSPFFFLGNNDGDSQSNGKPEGILEDIYRKGRKSNQQDAHIWRSQTLRLLMPPLRNDTSTSEKQLRQTTEDSIAYSADLKALEFLASPASFLMEEKARTDLTNKLKKIYSEAAMVSYMLWTRRTEMRCLTFQEIKQVPFNAESPYFDPDTLVRYDDHEDHLKGKKVTVMVHPLLEVHGTDEAINYDQRRTWAKGVVWLDSKNY